MLLPSVNLIQTEVEQTGFNKQIDDMLSLEKGELSEAAPNNFACRASCAAAWALCKIGCGSDLIACGYCNTAYNGCMQICGVISPEQ